MTITNGYCTLAEFKAYVTVRAGTITTDAADDTVIEDIIEAVSRRIDNLTGRRFWANTVDETRYYQTHDQYNCPVDDLVTITSVSVDYYDQRSYTALSTTTDYELEPANASTLGWPYNNIHILPTSTVYFPVSKRGVKVVGDFGFPAVPDNIKTATLEIALNVWMARQGQVSGGRMTVTASGIVIRPEDIPPAVMQEIQFYRKRT